MNGFQCKNTAFTLVELLVVLVIVFVVFAGLLGGFVLIETPFYLLFGWVWGLWRLVAGFVHEPSAVIFGVILFCLFPLAVHFFICPIAKRRNQSWLFKKSFVVSLTAVLIAGAGIAMVAGIHDILWLFGGEEPFMENRGGSGGVMMRLHSNRNLKQLGLGILTYNEAINTLPPGGTILDDGRLGHGWMTLILPFCGHDSSEIDLSKPWSETPNDTIFKQSYPDGFCSPYFRRLPMEEQKNRNGYIKTDYVGNQFVLPVGRSLKLGEIADGTANTILLGEAVHNLQPWGSPLNMRDPKLGINKSPYGFGSKYIGGVNFAMCDGSVMFHSEDIDPEILDALATPNGGEKIKPEL